MILKKKRPLYHQLKSGYYKSKKNHKEPDYELYKTALEYFQKGHFAFNYSRYSLKNLKQLFDINQESILKSARDALIYYIDAFKYFDQLVQKYPDSKWCGDAIEKMNSIEKLNVRYNTIIDLISL